jgi:hypothetical protein
MMQIRTHIVCVLVCITLAGLLPFVVVPVLGNYQTVTGPGHPSLHDNVHEQQQLLLSRLLSRRIAAAVHHESDPLRPNDALLEVAQQHQTPNIPFLNQINPSRISPEVLHGSPSHTPPGVSSLS